MRMIFIYSYRENPSLGDPNSLIEELLEMRNKIRIKETDLIMVRGKVNSMFSYTYLSPLLLYSLTLYLSPSSSPSLSPLPLLLLLFPPPSSPPSPSPHQLSLFTPLSSNGDAAGTRSSAVVDEALSPTQLESGKPTKSSEKFVIGRNHEFVESDVKFRIPPVCAYCSIIIQRTYVLCTDLFQCNNCQRL